jgi:hypothetical protein
LIDQQFRGQSREATESRLRGFVDRYLQYRYGAPEEGAEWMPTNNDHASDERFGALQRQLDQLSQAVTSLSERIEQDRQERLSHQAQAQRARRITSLCALVGLDSQQAAELIADQSLSVEDVKDKLLAMKLQLSKPAAGDAGSDQDSAEARLAAEYDRHVGIHRRLGVTRQAYVEHFQGGDGELEYMSPEWAEQYRRQLAQEAGLSG